MTSEKEIGTLVFDGNRCIIHLEDKSNAIIVHTSGAIALFEGGGDDRIHGFALTREDVLEFKVELVNNKIGISLCYLRKKQKTKHFLGFVKNEESARAWVERVNRIYNKPERQVNKQLEPRPGSPVVGFSKVRDTTWSDRQWLSYLSHVERMKVKTGPKTPANNQVSRQRHRPAFH
ncbi:MAG: hypothetical protein SFH39_03300 [Candidatus Magnetobacterium sp. LHC-1]|uniref:PH domain-containing protein n=1 Tax=Candidatus Magnetobacterium casense TaxID=1455061 RepID=A0ABS6RWP1_9BACT|nr:hypothetical protein [Candidatus Magnetobacterium casensis]MBF0608662.1 hypothetical protein [Nitrospirota bacterium]MBV6341054.1 hypothetical protein [Candidatus Magnetobacterium casensis]